MGLHSGGGTRSLAVVSGVLAQRARREAEARLAGQPRMAHVRGVATAAERNVKTRGHIACKEAILLALDLGVHIIDHGDGFDDECIERILARKAFLTPSLFFPKRMMTIAPGKAYTEAMRPEFEAMAAILPRANAAGVKLLIGDDFKPLTDLRASADYRSFRGISRRPRQARGRAAAARAGKEDSAGAARGGGGLLRACRAAPTGSPRSCRASKKAMRS